MSDDDGPVAHARDDNPGPQDDHRPLRYEVSLGRIPREGSPRYSWSDVDDDIPIEGQHGLAGAVVVLGGIYNQRPRPNAAYPEGGDAVQAQAGLEHVPKKLDGSLTEVERGRAVGPGIEHVRVVAKASEELGLELLAGYFPHF